MGIEVYDIQDIVLAMTSTYFMGVMTQNFYLDMRTKEERETDFVRDERKFQLEMLLRNVSGRTNVIFQPSPDPRIVGDWFRSFLTNPQNGLCTKLVYSIAQEDKSVSIYAPDADNKDLYEPVFPVLDGMDKLLRTGLFFTRMPNQNEGPIGAKESKALYIRDFKNEDYN